MDNFQLIFIIAIIFFGLIATVVYYFSRYYFRTSDDDKEVIPSLKKDKASSKPEVPKIEVDRPEDKKAKEIVNRKDLKEALSNTKANLFGRIKEKLSGDSLTEDDIESLEEVLYTSDLGPQTVQRLVEAVGEKLSGSDKSDIEKVRLAIKAEMLDIFLNSNGSELAKNVSEAISLENDSSDPLVWMIVGVNGAGKTTTIGKLAHHVSSQNKKVMVVAGDRFRAAADSQLKVWSERANVELFNPDNVKDPSAVAFDALSSAKAKNMDVVIVDTAGRLHTQDNLMEELKKMKRVMKKILPEAPNESFIVLDANSGQNALLQAKSFHEALGLTGTIITKLDGSAKGGVAVGVACELGLPIKLIGVGEGIEDLRPFQSKEFVESII